MYKLIGVALNIQLKKKQNKYTHSHKYPVQTDRFKRLINKAHNYFFKNENNFFLRKKKDLQGINMMIIFQEVNFDFLFAII